MSSTKALYFEKSLQKSWHNRINQNHLDELKNLFFLQPNKQLDANVLYTKLKSYKIDSEDEEFKKLCRQINMNSNKNLISWEEFISYLELQMLSHNPVDEDDLDLPIEKQLIKIQNTKHTRTIIGIGLRNVSNGNSNTYLTIDKHGGLSFWDNNLNELEYYSTKSALQISAIQVLSDIKTLVISTFEKKIHFYNISNPTQFYLLITVDLPHLVNCISYYSSSEESILKSSKLIFADESHFIRVMDIHRELKKISTTLSWADLLKGKIPQVTDVTCFRTPHKNTIRQVFYWVEFKKILSASCSYSSSSFNYPGLVITDVKGTHEVFFIPKGVNCFSFDTTNDILVTGGPDTFLRVWDPFVNDKPKTLFMGHNTVICYIFIQSKQNKIYSIDLEKYIKIWNIKREILIQTFNDLVTLFPTLEIFPSYYNHSKNELILAISQKCVKISCFPDINHNEIDGYTSNAGISVVLYNNYFENLITCDLNGHIIIWDIQTGRRQNLIKYAHRKNVCGKIIGIEITAACFNKPSKNYLITADADGNLKIWNYMTGVCLQQLIVGATHEKITAVFWHEKRIFAMGHNKRIREFGNILSERKMFHIDWNVTKDKIVCAAIRFPQTIATGSSQGNIILWNLETGYAYHQLNIRTANFENALKLSNEEDNIMITVMIFLETRPMNENIGTLFVAIKTNVIQVYSHHIKTRLIDKFQVTHKSGDYIISMTTDEKNEFLFVGTNHGYIGIWSIKYYCYTPNIKQHSQLTYLTRSINSTETEFVTENQPLLLNSFQGHLQTITSLEYINSLEILISGSLDKTCRLWSLKGQYLTTIGITIPWKKITENGQCRIPMDIKNVASNTTLKVLCNKSTDSSQNDMENQSLVKISTQDYSEIDKIDKERAFGKSLTEPILGKHFKLPRPMRYIPPPNLDMSSNCIPVYTHLEIHQTAKVVDPSTVKVLRKSYIKDN